MAESSYSYSSLRMFLDCPKQYQFARVDRVEKPSRKTADIELGNLVHRQLERMYKWAADGKLIPLSRVLEDHRAAWEHTDLAKLVVRQEHMAVDDFIDLGDAMLKAYYEKYQPFDHGVLLGAEMNLKFRLGTTPFELTAKIDRLTKLPDGTVEIVDYKTGSHPPPNGLNDTAFRRQLGLYELAVRTNHPNIERIVQKQHWLRQDHVIDKVARPDELEELAEEVRQNILDIKWAITHDDFPTREGGYCAFCDYVDICPAKRHRQILEEESGVEGDEKELAQLAAERTEEYISLEQQKKEITARQDQIKTDLIDISKQLNASKFKVDQGSVSVSVKNTESFVVKSHSPDEAAELESLAREWNLTDSCFTLDGKLLMKLYKSESLSEEQRERLKDFIISRTTESVRPYLKKITNDDDE